MSDVKTICACCSIASEYVTLTWKYDDTGAYVGEFLCQGCSMAEKDKDVLG